MQEKLWHKRNINTILSPQVCGSDGKTYGSECELRRAGCSRVRRQGRSFESGMLKIEVGIIIWSLSLSLSLSSSGYLPRGLQGAVCRHGQSRPVPGLRVASNKLRWDEKRWSKMERNIVSLNFLCFIRWEFASDFPHHMMAQVQIPPETEIVPILRYFVRSWQRSYPSFNCHLYHLRPLRSRFLPLRDNVAGPGHGAQWGPGLLSDKIWQVLQNLRDFAVFKGNPANKISNIRRLIDFTQLVCVAFLPKNHPEQIICKIYVIFWGFPTISPTDLMGCMQLFEIQNININCSAFHTCNHVQIPKIKWKRTSLS